MKLIVFAIILLLSGIPNIVNPEHVGVGIVCTLAGAAILIYKFIASRGETNAKSYIVSKPPVRSGPTCRICGVRIHDDRVTNANSLCGKCWMKKHDELDAFEVKRKPVLSEHYRLCSEIKSARSAAFAAKDPCSPLWDEVVSLCQQDIHIEPAVRKYNSELHRRSVDLGYYSENDMPANSRSYLSFSVLSRIYEMRGDYEAAIDICQQAINAGYTISELENTLADRIIRLKKKLPHKSQSPAAE